jgi:hypothetical protein
MHKNSRDYLEQECTRLSKELGYTVLFDSINGGLLYHIKIIDQLAKLHKEALG